MNITIEIDPSKIDYDKITEQIAEKFKDADISDIITSNCLIEKIIRDIIYQRVSNKFEDYLLNELRWINVDGQITDTFKRDFREHMDKTYKEKILDQVNEEVNKIDKESIDEAITKITPQLLIAVIDDYCKGVVYNSATMFRDQAFSDAKGLIRYTFGCNGMPVNTNIDRHNVPTSDY